MLKEILDRRSIRKFQDSPVPKAMVEEILRAGLLAPSSKNRQPWKFLVVSGSAKDEMISVLNEGLSREQESPLLPESGRYLAGAEQTFRIMDQAPIVILIINLLGSGLHRALPPEERVYEICNAQSIGAAIENMALQAAALGLGSLWICDTYFSHQELCGWLNGEGEPFAALALGFPAESPSARPRKELKEAVEWRE